MKKKINKLLLFIFIFSLVITGCSSEEEKEEVKEKKPVTVNDSILKKIDKDGSGRLNCKRFGVGEVGVDFDLNYEIKYQDGFVTFLHSSEKVITEKNSVLDEYENAYNGIKKHYEGIKYYDFIVTRGSNYVVNEQMINYSEVDTERILEIEGKEGNVIKNGKLKLEDWVKFAEKYGTKCIQVE